MITGLENIVAPEHMVNFVLLAKPAAGEQVIAYGTLRKGEALLENDEATQVYSSLGRDRIVLMRVNNHLIADSQGTALQVASADSKQALTTYSPNNQEKLRSVFAVTSIGYTKGHFCEVAPIVNKGGSLMSGFRTWNIELTNNSGFLLASYNDARTVEPIHLEIERFKFQTDLSGLYADLRIRTDASHFQVAGMHLKSGQPEKYELQIVRG